MDRNTLERICQRIEDGALILDACKAEGIGATSTLRRWLQGDKATDADRSMYASARLMSADALAEEALEVARCSTAETYQQDRLRIDTLKWSAAKRRPKEYGDRVEHEVGGSIGVLHLDALRAPRIHANAMLAKGLEAIASGDTSPEEPPYTGD